MAIKMVIEDDDGQELKFFLNAENQLIIGAGDFKQDPVMWNGSVSLDKEDALQLLEKLTELVREM